MKIYRHKTGIILEKSNKYFTLPYNDWDLFINDDDLFSKLESCVLAGKAKPVAAFDESGIMAPIGSQELWACGVTYLRSKIGRQEESKTTGGADFYAKVYEAERPEVFFKSTPHRVVANNGQVRIRKDSTWNVPEPELTLSVTSNGKIVGYTIGNDMSSRSIEGENPLYLPQAKTYDGCAALGPCIYVTNEPLDGDTRIGLVISRSNQNVFEADVMLKQMKRSPQELVSFVYRECSFPTGCLVMTGTGIVPGQHFTLQSGDVISINIDNIGTLVNTVQ